MGRELSVLGRVLAAPARSAMLNLLMDGTTRPASELAAYARVSAATTSEHLAVLRDAGLVVGEARGRHRYYRLASAEVAEALEHLGQLCPETVPNSYRRSREAADLARARFCYDHLAGQLGLAVTDALQDKAWLDGELQLTDNGDRHFTTLGIDVAALRKARRPLTRPCLDWTERRPHLAGSLGAAFADLVLTHQWVRRRPSGRGLELTTKGAAELATLGFTTI